MTRYARINAENQIEAIREFAYPPDPNPAKGWTWLPFETEPTPSFNARLESVIQNRTVNGQRVVESWTVERLARNVQTAAVKEEARLRILARFPDWKQANMLAREGELGRIEAGLMRNAQGARLDARALTEMESQELQAINQAWEWIKAVRACSDEIEAMNPIPDDFASNARWPE